MVHFAFSLPDQIEKYGSYVGIASFFGLAVLSLLYFAQAREVRRLREWAGRSPERAQELEERVVTQAGAVRRVPQPVPARVPEPVAVAAATNGAHKLKPEQVAALAFARAAGVAEPPHPPKVAPVAQPVAAAVAAPPTEAAPIPPTAPPAPLPANGNDNGHGRGDVPAPATPAARRPAAQPLRQAPPPRRPAPAPARRAPSGPPPRRETSARSVVLMVILGVVAVGLVAFAGTKLLGGGGDTPAGQSNKNAIVPAGETATPDSGSQPKATPTPDRATTTVAVLNGTTELGLAASTQDKLLTAGYEKGNTSAGNNPTSDQQRSSSVVMYVDGARAKAKDVARVLDIKDVKAIDAATQANGGGKDVVVVVGSDKSGN
jgi:hypothetical protein